MIATMVADKPKPVEPRLPAMQTLVTSPMPQDPKNGVVFLLVSYPYAYQPLYTLATQQKQIQLSRAPNSMTGGASMYPAGAPIGTLSFGSLSSTTDISIGDQMFTMKRNHRTLAKDYVFECPHNLGQMEWKAATKGPEKEIGLLELRDARDAQLARYSTQLPAGRLFEVLVSCDKWLLEIMLVTGIAAARIYASDVKNGKMVVELANGLGGLGA